MNDAELLTRVKDSFAEVRADTPLTGIERRGRAVRARRRRRSLTVTVAVAAAVAVAVALTQQPGAGTHTGPGTQLAAWTIIEKPPGIIEIKIRQLKDPVGMQRELRSDGVPAFVRFTNQNPPDCLYYPMAPAKGQKLTQRIFPQPGEAQIEDNVALVINTAAIPPGVGLWIEFMPPQTTNLGNGLATVAFGTSYTLVYPSGRCPGAGSPR